MASKRTTSELESHVGYWLRVVSNHVSHAFKLKVEAHGVTVAEWVVMRGLLGQGAVNPSTLAESLGLSRGAVSKLIDRLVTKGLASCGKVKEDRRFQVVALTASGRSLVPKLAALADDNDREFFGHFSAAERTALAAALQGLALRHGFTGAAVD